MSVRRTLRRLAAETRGAAALEFVIWTAALAAPLLIAFDFAVYSYQRMEAQIAAQAGAEYVWHLCDYSIGGTPAFDSTKCPKLSLANITTAVQNTTLGTGVTVSAIGEGYYCVDSTGARQGPYGTATTAIGTAPTPPSPNTCANVTSGSTTPPGDYVSVTVAYTYKPIFSGLSVGNQSITQTAYVRLNQG